MWNNRNCIYWSLPTVPQRRQWQPTPVLLPGKSHGWRSLVGYSPWGREEPEDWATSLSLSFIGEGNGNPLQCSFLENASDGRAWWAVVYEGAQSWIWLKWLSSSSSSYSSWYRGPESSVISWMIRALGASFVLILVLWFWFLTQSPQISWNFLGDRRDFVLMMWLWVSSLTVSGWGPVLWKTKLWGEAWNFQYCHCPPPLERGEELKVELIAHHAYMMKCPYKSPKYRVQRASELVKTSKCWELVHCNYMGTELLHLRSF